MNLDKLLNTIQDTNINFLIGSGMSAPYLSTLWNIERLLTEVATNDIFLDENQKKLARASLYKKFFDDVIEKNIDILQNEPSSKNMIDNYKNFFSNLNRLLLIRRNKLLSKQVNIFTTNIDVCLEKSLEDKGFEFNDGFSGRFNPRYDLSNFKKSVFKRSLHYENNSEIPIFNILKLHGSLTWAIEHTVDSKAIVCDTSLNQIEQIKKAKPSSSDKFIVIEDNDDFITLMSKLPHPIDNTDIENFISEYEKLAIVNPTKEKFHDTLMNQTYYELLRIYANELEKENSLLFVMGFSFADEHIKELTLRVANSNPTLLIIIFAYTNDAKEQIENNIDMSKVKNRNIIIESPTLIKNDDDSLSDKFNYDFNTINQNCFTALLNKIENINE